jgi:hypothetical protein
MGNQGLRSDLSGRSLAVFEKESMAGQRRECFANFNWWDTGNPKLDEMHFTLMDLA